MLYQDDTTSWTRMWWRRGGGRTVSPSGSCVIFCSCRISVNILKRSICWLYLLYLLLLPHKSNCHLFLRYRNPHSSNQLHYDVLTTVLSQYPPHLFWTFFYGKKYLSILELKFVTADAEFANYWQSRGLVSAYSPVSGSPQNYNIICLAGPRS